LERMADKSTNPKTDPAALAFSAVESALKDSMFSLDEPTKASEKPAESPAANQPPRRDSQANERLAAADKIAARAGRVANDDAVASGLYGVQTRASSAGLWLAFLASLVWVAGVGAIAWLRYADDFAAGTTPAQ